MHPHSNAELKSLIERQLGSYLIERGFAEGPHAEAPRVRSITYSSPELQLSFFSESQQDFYVKVGPPGDSPPGYYLGAALAFLAGAPEPYLDLELLAKMLPQRHQELVSLFAKNSQVQRGALDVWVSEFAQRSVAAMQTKALEAKSKRKWWRFGT